MSLNIKPLTSTFGAEITGVDIVSPLADDDFAAIRSVFEVHGVLYFPDQPMDDDQQVAFSDLFGPLERTVSTNPAGGSPFARQSNIDIETGERIPLDDPRMAYQKGNYLWHADSTFKTVPSLCSVLSAREVPPDGGATEFVSTAAAYDALDDEMKVTLEDLVVEHDFAYSRQRTGFQLTDTQIAELPAARHRLVRVNPETGRKSLMIGAHAKEIIGWPLDKGQALLDDLLVRATENQAVYRHAWRTGDVLVWDNRATLHRATVFDAARHRRIMQRTTVSDMDVEYETN
ncbi:MAG: TauD/TfdA family dioxygenase [Rhodospirillaceae bacterium]|jgi:alpha-ketoglutarate-dependent 2,4-dichlorophenoxyacetate dioxygenase|nr:TauD/TfdA family dioxygenase [Rhodospirillaceae bacterium]